ncbi:hypothetical protein [Haloferula sp. BvORR071]|uniref:hypothetical protein n=1 Tax=Haloferula sp. BvORR071 TaxID=1396141 RepID=UPI0005556C44|nr:hypothetical protein [Haloferula sp. BvORR071]
MDINTRLQDDLPPDSGSDSGRYEAEAPPSTRVPVPRPTSKLTKPSPASKKSSLRTLRILRDLLGD